MHGQGQNTLTGAIHNGPVGRAEPCRAPIERRSATMLTNEVHEITSGLFDRLLSVVVRLNGAGQPTDPNNKVPSQPINGTLDSTRSCLRACHEAVNEIEQLLF